MALVPDGEGRSSKKWRKTHRFKGAGRYWRSEEDFKAWQEEYNAKRRKDLEAFRKDNPPKSRAPHNPRAAGQGIMSMKPRPTHPYYARGKYWLSEQHFRVWADEQALKKRADRNEVSIDRQLEIEAQARASLVLATKREDKIHAEFNRLKQKHGLRKNATRIELRNVYAKTLDPEIKMFFHLESVALMKADEKLEAIREMFLTPGIRPQDILYRTALMVGVAMKEKQ